MTHRAFGFLVCLCIVIMSNIIIAQESQETYTITLAMRDAVKNKDLANILVEMVITAEKTEETRTISSFIDKHAFDLELEEGAYGLRFYVDDLGTKGKDYVGSQRIDLTADQQQTIALLPIGSVQGTVLDNLNNLVRRAALKTTCEKDYADRVPETTDNFGSFESLYLPVGECQITANFGTAIGYQKITIMQGSLSEVTITLDRSTIGRSISGWILLVVVLLAGLGIVWIGIRFYNQKKQTKPVLEKQEKTNKEEPHGQQQAKEHNMTKRQQDLLNTLNEREKKVVQFLLESQGKSTQAKVRYETGIPKTSLVRVFTSLEYKKIITVEKIGKLKKIKLTDWFIEKE